MDPFRVKRRRDRRGKKAPYRSNDDVSEFVVPLVPPMPSPHK